MDFPTRIDDFDDHLRLVGDAPPDVGPPGPGSIVPKNLLAFQWVVEEVDGSFVDSQLVMRRR